MRNCIVPFCKNRGSIAGLTYFRVTENRRERWLRAIGRRLDNNLSTESSICSDHFKLEDFEIKENRQVLKSSAVPTQKLRPVDIKKQLFIQRFSKPHSEVPENDRRTESILDDSFNNTFQLPPTNQDSNLIEQCLTSQDSNLDEPRSSQGDKKTEKNAESDSSSTSNTSISSGNSRKRKQNIIPLSSDSEGLTGSPKKRRLLLRMMHNYSKSPRKLTHKVTELKGKNKQLKVNLRTEKLRTSRLKKKVGHLGDIVTELKRLQLLSGTAREVLEKSYSGIPDAIIKRLMLNAKKGKMTTIKYPKEIKEFAMTLQFYSSKAYNYVRKTFDLALPSPSVIRNWLTNVECEPGFTDQAFTSLKMQVENDKLRGVETICSLMLDEMSIKKQIEFISNKMWGYVDCGTGIQEDDLSCAREALVLMVVAVNNHWKLPIAYFLINSLTAAEKANIVKEALIKLDEVGVKITSITCDGPSAHISMAQKLGAQIDPYSGNISSEFKHPANDSKVFVIFDVCHMLKLLRTAWASMGLFIDEDGGRIDYEYVTKLHNIQESEMLRFGNKLKRAHIEWEKQKMKVNLAAQLLSNSVADALEFLMVDVRHPNFQGAGPTIRFLKLVDRVFDLLNSRNPFGRGCKAPLRQSNVEYWRLILLQGIQFFKTTTDFNGNLMMKGRRKTPFLGFITAITSVFGIFDTYVASDTPSLKYLLTYKLSQDHLELFFCAIRSKNGWNNNPTAFQFYTTYRRMLMHAEVRNNNGNCLSQDCTEMLQLSREPKKTDTETLTLNDISLLKKYGLPIHNNSTQEEEDTEIPEIPDSSLLTDNIVAFISGFVVRMAKKKLKCTHCSLALECLTDSFRDDFCMLLVNRKTNGGLVRASKDVFTICLHAEKKIRFMLNVSNQSLPRQKNFFELFVLGLSTELISCGKIFDSLNNHSLSESAVMEENHTVLLIKLIVRCYCRIRWFNVAKRQTDKLRGELIRKTYTKLILFRNQ